MDQTYIISIDQSTQGTKALLFDHTGKLQKRSDIAHRQIISENGWVSHEPEEIYRNTICAVKKLIEESGIDCSKIQGIGISNQRETTVVWNKKTGKPVTNAIVWQCARAEEICEREKIKSNAKMIQKKTGLKLSPYFPAAKMAWILENIENGKTLKENHSLCFGTIDTWLIYKLTGGKSYKTDYSNASRTQLFNIFSLEWDKEICQLFDLNPEDLPEVCDSDSIFGMTDFEGQLEKPIPIHAVLGDSHGALFGQGCLNKGDIKATYGTGSSIMMNIGEKPVLSSHGVVTSLAWGINGKVNYVLEGNINYTGAVLSWLKDDVKLIDSPDETENLCKKAKQEDELYLVPAFTGLGAPHWKSNARAALTGISRTTGKAEIVRAGIECIAYQITDVIRAMEADADEKVQKLRVDGGPTKNGYLMQFQSDILGSNVIVPEAEELSGIGAAYAAGIAMGIYNKNIFENMKHTLWKPQMAVKIRDEKYKGWTEAVKRI